MSDDSTNFVQNKVIKQYVDMLVKELKDNQDNYVPTSRQIGSVSLDDDITLEKLGGMVTNAFSAGGSWMSTLVPFMQMYCGSKTQQDDNTTAISELTEAQEKKLDIAQGEDNANKNVVTDDEGNVTTEDVQTIPTVLDTIEITEECTGALTFSNIQEYFKRYKKLKIFAIMPYTETNTETAQIYVAGHSLATFNASSCWVYYSSKGQQTTKRVSRL
jgi:hypothetical protein